MSGQHIGYIRVSTAEQNTARQLDGVTLDKVFEDHASGKDIVRPQLTACLQYVREGDTLHLHSIDRLARSLIDLQRTVDELVGRGVTVVFHKENLSFAAGSLDNGEAGTQRLMLQMMGAFAEFERNLIKDRQREGVALAKAAGKYRGRQRVLSTAQFEEIKDRLREGETVTALAREFNVCRHTIHKYLHAEGWSRKAERAKTILGMAKKE